MTVVLVVLDGFGIGDDPQRNALMAAPMWNWHRLLDEFPHARLGAAGADVGLPDGQMGNSEVGHLNLGAGFRVLQDLPRITQAIADGSFFENDVLGGACREALASGGRLHLMGLVGPGGIHAVDEHLVAMVELAHRTGLPPDRVLFHAFTDGRDTPPRSADAFLPALEGRFGGHARVATVSGRYWAMDRDTRWDRVGRAYAAIVEREGLAAPDALTAVKQAYDRGEGDEFVQPTVVEGGLPLRDGDTVVHFNFRADRARELTNAITGVRPERFAGQLERRTVVKPAVFVCLTEYDAEYGLPVAFPNERPGRMLGEVISQAGLRQLRIAETEKYAHVTFFFNCGEEKPFAGEDRVLIPSPRDVPTYDHKPEMSAPGVTEELLRRIESGVYDFILVNYANPDMVGHTGVESAAVKAVEVVDQCLARVAEAVLAHGGTLLVTADHGNCELMVDPETGEPHTAHTTNPVPIWWVVRDPGRHRLRDGTLRDLAPSVLALLALPVPDQMTGRSLVD